MKRFLCPEVERRGLLQLSSYRKQPHTCREPAWSCTVCQKEPDPSLCRDGPQLASNHPHSFPLSLPGGISPNGEPFATGPCFSWSGQGSRFPGFITGLCKIASRQPTWPSSIYNNVAVLLGGRSQLGKRGGLVGAFILKVSLQGQEKRVPQKTTLSDPTPSPLHPPSQSQAGPLRMEAPQHHGEGRCHARCYAGSQLSLPTQGCRTW